MAWRCTGARCWMQCRRWQDEKETATRRMRRRAHERDVGRLASAGNSRPPRGSSPVRKQECRFCPCRTQDYPGGHDDTLPRIAALGGSPGVAGAGRQAAAGLAGPAAVAGGRATRAAGVLRAGAAAASRAGVAADAGAGRHSAAFAPTPGRRGVAGPVIGAGHRVRAWCLVLYDAEGRPQLPATTDPGRGLRLRRLARPWQPTRRPAGACCSAPIRSSRAKRASPGTGSATVTWPTWRRRKSRGRSARSPGSCSVATSNTRRRVLRRRCVSIRRATSGAPTRQRSQRRRLQGRADRLPAGAGARR